MKISDIIVESGSTGPKFGGYYGATQKGPPKPGQGFGGAAESVGVALDEVAPSDQEDWIRKNKERFIKQYGKERGTRILYATANKRSNANESRLTSGKKD